MSDRPPSEPPSPDTTSVARPLVLGIVMFAATLILLFGLSDVISRRSAPSATAAHTPASTPVTTAVGTSASPGSSASAPGASPTAVPGSGAGSPSPSPTAGDPVLVGAGDIADCRYQGDVATAGLLDGIDGTVFTAGDNTGPDGSSTVFKDCYGPTWGRHARRTRPAPGDLDWGTAHLAGYLGFFPMASTDGQPWYAYDLGTWHVIVLDSDCGKVGGCGPDSAQGRWLAADLAASKASCTVAIWHHPRFSSGTNGDTAAIAPFWDALYTAGADVVINAHDPDYERFAPQDPAGHIDRARGLREFVVGTGGTPLGSFQTPRPNSELRVSLAHGVLKLVLHKGSYDWTFVPTEPLFEDHGTAACH
ncbi:MAG: alkaline phosphatase [Chloroflexota bacterium]